MCLAQGHNAVTPVRLEPAAPRSRVKLSTTEPLRSLLYNLNENETYYPKTLKCEMDFARLTRVENPLGTYT